MYIEYVLFVPGMVLQQTPPPPLASMWPGNASGTVAPFNPVNPHLISHTPDQIQHHGYREYLGPSCVSSSGVTSLFPFSKLLRVPSHACKHSSPSPATPGLLPSPAKAPQYVV